MSDHTPPLPADPAATAPSKPRRKKAAPKAAPPDLAPEDLDPSPMARPRLFALSRRQLRRWVLRTLGGVCAAMVAVVWLFGMINPPRNIYQWNETWRLGGIEQSWVSIDQIAPAMQRAVVAAEDANFCRHWGFDMAEIRRAIDSGGARGASTLTQQVAKNVFLWQGRSWLRKALEAPLTPLVELFWSKERILEVYLNIAEFDEGVFGVEAAAHHYFGVSAAKLSDLQAARLAAILPDPKNRSASKPTDFVRKRTRGILSGMATIAADGRDRCFR